MTSSPYVIGGALGLLNTFAFATAKRGLGVTTAFESTAALAGRELAPDAMHVNAYVAEREETPKIDWETLLVAGVLAGSFLASRGTSDRASRAAASRRSGPGGYAAAFVGGAVMMFGARMAKGCTSGHGLTGMAQLALSSWVFSPIMFATAAAVSRALHGEEARR